mmetsp:Transcript_44107/g.75037  ORF Transcript_44107/g.75037 Transcript_44107/m.75037 type:complete len:94 (+) Transcript_44107:211-492(+)
MRDALVRAGDNEDIFHVVDELCARYALPTRAQAASAEELRASPWAAYFFVGEHGDTAEGRDLASSEFGYPGIGKSSWYRRHRRTQEGLLDGAR